MLFASPLHARPLPFAFPPAIDESPMAMFVVDPATGAFLASNRAAQALYGWSREEFQALSVSDLNQMQQSKVAEDLDQAVQLQKNFFEFSQRLKDGELREISMFSWPITEQGETLLMSVVLESRDAGRTYAVLNLNRLNLAFIAVLCILGATVLLLVFIIFRRRRLVRELGRQHLLLRVMMDAIPDQIYFRRPDRQIVACNQAAAEFLGMPVEMIVGKSDRELFGESEDSLLRQQIFGAIDERDNHVVQGEVTSPTGKKHTLEMFRAPVIDPSGKPFGTVSIWRDITDRRRNEERIEALAFYDPLTKLANRARAQEVLLDLLATHRQSKHHMALAIFDLDNFAAVNSIFGHNIGDALLRATGRRLSNTIEAGSFAARLSSDEFLVLLTELGDDRTTALQTAQERIDRLHEKLSQKAFVNSHHITPSTCVGAVLVGPDAESANDELRRADLAMHNAKAKGRGSISWFHDDMVDQLVSRFDLETALERALQTNGFSIYLQPIINRNASGRHFEALLRLDHPERGVISPGDFIDVAESTGLIVPIGAWVLEEACKLLSEYPDLHLSVNVSVQQFLQEDFVEHLCALLERYDFAPNHLTLEMTESLMIANFELTLSQLMAIRDLKIRLSIDDFGTGYSALLYLKQLPLDELKIDQSFISGVPHDSNDTSLVELIITTAHHLGLVIVAEGVETPEQEEWLRRHGCESLQGYLFSRPQPIKHYLPSFH
ncbi:EAL domain-containing protein [Martelella mediterranea]|uniref:sensor domain-containing protein n=1 Tax=Martelella mediterranea TaxID=293089 RepID=UPI002E7AD27D|nr:EAL domain-containing protein [Martelella mediterranea]